jgi:hypothetical protein
MADPTAGDLELGNRIPGGRLQFPFQIDKRMLEKRKKIGK